MFTWCSPDVHLTFTWSPDHHLTIPWPLPKLKCQVRTIWPSPDLHMISHDIHLKFPCINPLQTLSLGRGPWTWQLFPALVFSSYLSVIVTLSGNLWRDFYPIFKDILRSEIGKMSGARSVKDECIVSPFENSIYFRVYRLHFQDIFKMNGLKLGS